MGVEVPLKHSVMEILDQLPPDGIEAVLDFARFIRSKTESTEKPALPIVKVGSFTELKPLIGKFDLEGDAVVDCEQYWK
jgi:hypothetical protein